MVKVNNVNVGRCGHGEEGVGSRGGKKGKGKQVPRSEASSDKFISVKGAANYEDWTKKKRKIAPRHRVDLSDMGKHMLATQSSSTKCLPHGCFLTNMFQYFEISFSGPSDHIGIDKIYNQNTFKRMGFSRNEDGELIRGGQEEESENSEEEDEEGNEPEGMDEDEKNVEEIQRELKFKKRQEIEYEGQSSVDMAQLIARIITMQSQFNSRVDDIDGKLHNRLDAIDDKTVYIQNWNKRSIFRVSRLHKIEAKDLGDQGITKKKRSSH
ncbi:hypothetical protein M9H77_34706 [Catharanthus roseus]|uniref:Uncharacterized protein n=1 Tax=Catharanthus roseus TaxID=4058 RepID=A0ACB9ZPG4_CATRO|nr:hypothetical protein M9H77_34706 [Catharanthus roseus]